MEIVFDSTEEEHKYIYADNHKLNICSKLPFTSFNMFINTL